MRSKIQGVKPFLAFIGIGLSIAFAAPTHADILDDEFRYQLGRQGVMYSGPTYKLGMFGRAVCDELTRGVPVTEVVRKLYSDGLITAPAPSIWVNAAITVYCPELDYLV